MNEVQHIGQEVKVRLRLEEHSSGHGVYQYREFTKISMRKSTKSALKIITIKHDLVQSQLPTNNRTIIKIFSKYPGQNF